MNVIVTRKFRARKVSRASVNSVPRCKRSGEGTRDGR
jgi:hypothetical protein